MMKIIIMILCCGEFVCLLFGERLSGGEAAVNLLYLMTALLRLLDKPKMRLTLQLRQVWPISAKLAEADLYVSWSKKRNSRTVPAGRQRRRRRFQ